MEAKSLLQCDLVRLPSLGEAIPQVIRRPFTHEVSWSGVSQEGNNKSPWSLLWPLVVVQLWREAGPFSPGKLCQNSPNMIA